MRLTICMIATLALATATGPAYAKAAAKAAAFDIDHTTWTFTDKKGTHVRESVDARGNYIAESTAGKHLDHGTAVMKDGKACFTSAMTKEGEVCWTTPKNELKVGHSFTTTSDKGEKLRVTRVAYKELKMPK